MTSTSQLHDLIASALAAAGLLEAMEMVNPKLAAKIRPVSVKLQRDTWAAMGRPEEKQGVQ